MIDSADLAGVASLFDASPVQSRAVVEGDSWKKSGETMSLEYIISGLIAVALLAYLMYALIRPEKF